VTVNVQIVFDAFIKPVNPICEDEPAFPMAGATLGGTWSGVGITDPVTGTFDPNVAGPGVHTITYEKLGFCGATATTDITVYEVPTARFVSDTNQGCVPVRISFSNQSSGTFNSCLWDFGDGNTSTDCDPNHEFESPGLYDVSLTVTNQHCSDQNTIVDMIEVMGYPKADFNYTPDFPSVKDPIIDFTNLSLDADSFYWSFDSYGNSSEEHPSFEFPSDQGRDYEICLEAYNKAGCDASICKVIFIKGEFYIYVPNAFTPNEDGTNDGFKPVMSGEQPTDYTLMIFNRWGDKVFETTDNTEFWDGTVSGVAAQQDVYIWKVELFDTANNKFIKLSGHVTLIR
ncbi:MAG: gliding motility-associated C-terminal domain-containing protein, partial [Flavobacteriales bacterium]|nr:gliding motility-associated C-terminal domain-containing protein [Flavobacteriales bacterium]